MLNKVNDVKRLKAGMFSVSLLALMATMPVAIAQERSAADRQQDRPTVSKKKPTSANATVNLVNLLVKQGVLDEEQAANLIKQAEDEAYVAREAARDATVKADEAAKAATAAASAASPAGSKRVTYVPEIVKRQLREDIRQEVMSKARAEKWASPGMYPEWASRIRFSGDFRGRWEAINYPSGGYNAPGNYIDFNAINTGSGYDVSDANLKPFPTYNAQEPRDRARLRARLGVDVDLFEGFTAGMRLATGNDSSPVSTNQTMGSGGGNFSKYAIWLDRAFVKFEPFKYPAFANYPSPDSMAITVGRFDNPFWSPTDLVWHRDLGFDGIALQIGHEVAPGLRPFLVAGAFPIFNTALDFSSAGDTKFRSEDRYLFGGQVGFSWQAYQDITATFGAGIFSFSNVQARQSSLCSLDREVACDTDGLRPSFAQKGNTYTYLREILPPAGWPPGDRTYSQPQYYGLASKFMPAVFSGRLDFAQFNPVHVILDGEFVWNTAFNRDGVAALAMNNRAPDVNSEFGPFNGGNIGWMTRLTVGHPKLAQFGDWNVHVGYKYLESDATIDAFGDSDFGLGGTNLKGYFVGGNFAVASNVWLGARWMSANAISGVPYAVDVFQIDLNAKF